MDISTLTAPVVERAEALLMSRERILIGIDGRCASGKTTLAEALASRLSGHVFHADDYFLPPELRTPKRYGEPGGNMHRERLEAEILSAVQTGSVTYRRFDCHRMAYEAPVTVKLPRTVIVEGSYCLHAQLIKYYDIKVFITADADSRLARIEKRNGKEAVKTFSEKWIPLEEAYFAAHELQYVCDFVVRT